MWHRCKTPCLKDIGMLRYERSDVEMAGERSTTRETGGELDPLGSERPKYIYTLQMDHRLIIIIIIIHLYSVFSQWSKNASQKGNYNYKLPMTIKNKI